MAEQENMDKPEQAHSPGDRTLKLGIYSPNFQYKQESLQFFRSCVGDAVYERAMQSEAGRTHHYVVVRAFLSQPDWEKFVWIEEYGSLMGFPEAFDSDKTIPLQRNSTNDRSKKEVWRSNMS